jgi:PP-loop superfamily ATP-utilizing enzyme
MKDYDRIVNIMNGNETVRILENMKENLKTFDERRESLIEKENNIKNKMSKDGFDDVLKDLGIF